MIWHFFEVWVLMLVAFAIGCPLGAMAYKLIASGPLGNLQGDFADVVGDVVDGIKSRLGIGPVWRPEYRRLVERRSAEDADDDDGRGEAAGRQEPRLLIGGGVPMLPDLSVPRADAAGDRAEASAAVVASEAGEDAEEAVAMVRPMGLAAPRNGVPDDLQRIRGIGRRIEQRLNDLGIYHFGQIAAWTPAEMGWMAQQLAFPERIAWDDWIGQAIVLAAGGDTGFVKSAGRRRQRRREQALEEALARGTEDDDTNGPEVDQPFAEDDAGGDEQTGGGEDDSAIAEVAIASAEADPETAEAPSVESEAEIAETGAEASDDDAARSSDVDDAGGKAGTDEQEEPAKPSP